MNWNTLSFSFIKISLVLLFLSSCSWFSEGKEPIDQVIIGEQESNKNLWNKDVKQKLKVKKSQTLTGAQQTALYFPLLKDKTVGVVANNTSFVNQTHLVDTLLASGIHVKMVFSPEHGFRGDQDAGAKVKHAIDADTGLPIYSLHGSTKKPSKKSLQGIEVILFDIQDVGVRFYTYLSTLHYVMEACAENNIKLYVLDRPNPNAHYVAGPVLEKAHRSFVGMHPVPIVYGMSIGEYSTMINGEGWLKGGAVCDLEVIPLKYWNHQKECVLPIAPSPNLTSQLSIYLYPHLCLFEGTEISVGRGTTLPFEQYGHPSYLDTAYSFVPKSIKGKSLKPPFKDEKCFGQDLSGMSLEHARGFHEFKLTYLLDAKSNTRTNNFFAHASFFNLLAGNNSLLKMIESGMTEKEIQKSWNKKLNGFKEVRAKYLIYP
jgi:uncharacterized protein YbbC (DUF1343 family)